MYKLFFENIAKHIQLDSAERDYLASKLLLRTTVKAEVLLREGAYCNHLFFVQKGCLRIFQNHQDGTQTNILFCPENWWASDIISFSDGAPAEYAIEALEICELVCINAADLEELYTKIPKLERFFRILFQNGFALYQRRLTVALSNSAEIRYELFRKQYPTLMNRIAQKHIASYLGITPVFLSMIRKRL